MISVENMPSSAQKAYNFTNKVRIISFFVSLTVIGFALLFNVGQLIITRDREFIAGAIVMSGFGFMIHSVVHSEFVLKSIMRSFGIFGIFVGTLVFGFGLSLGWIFFVVDSILLFLKKPLIYPFENKYFLRLKEVQVELEEEYLKMAMNSGASTMNDLQKLKEMLEQGIITEEDYNKKKAQLLERI